MIDPDCDVCRVFTHHEKTHGPTAQDILLGVLGNCHEGILIGFDDGCFQLITLVPEGDPDILCQHEDWHQFLRLVSEYTDYVSEEDSDDENG